jgi:hypothetical protein
MRHVDVMMDPGYDPEGFQPQAGRLRLFGGGGGSNKYARAAEARERERQARIEAATAATNRLFGMGDDPEAQAALASRTQLYDTVRGDTRDFYAKQLAEDRAEAERQMRFQLARGGGYGGSQGIDLESEFARRNDRGLMEVANRADSAASGLRSSDEQARLGILAKVLGGMDQGSALSSSLNQMQSNAEMGRQNAMAGRMANVFDDLFGVARGGQQQAGAQQARDKYGSPTGNFFPNESAYGGSVSR